MIHMKNVNFTKIFFGSGALILLVIIFNHLFSIISFTLNINIHRVLFPLGFLTATGFYFLLNKENVDKNHFAISIGICCLVFISSLITASAFYDFSWDGLWYHQASIHFLKEGWNPFYQPDFDFNGCAKTSVLHFAKGPWYISANIFSTCGNFESSKGINIIVMFAVYFLVYSTAREYQILSVKSHLISIMVILNPVMITQLLSFLVDQLLISYLVIYIALFIKWLKDKNRMSILLAVISAICLINTKFTGLVFFVIASCGMITYLILRSRNKIKQILIWQVSTLLLGVLVFGYNPYVTNTIHWGHPFYPIIDPAIELTAKEKDKNDMNEQYETPKNMVGESTIYRFFYATFSRPGNAPFNNEVNANLMLPFDSNTKDWNVYRFHEARVSGFGPYFSGILILSFVLGIMVSFKHKQSIIAFVIFGIGILISIFINKHFWIPRFGPQFWYIAVVPIALAWFFTSSKVITRFSYVILFLILINSGIITFVHLNWEKSASDKLNLQHSEIKEAESEILVYCRWFKKSIAERFDKVGIDFQYVNENELDKLNKTELQSIVDGYPGKVFFSVKE